MRLLCIEIYKTLNNLNPQYMNEIFAENRSFYSFRRPYNLTVPRISRSTFGLRSIRYEGHKISNWGLSVFGWRRHAGCWGRGLGSEVFWGAEVHGHLAGRDQSRGWVASVGKGTAGGAIPN